MNAVLALLATACAFAIVVLLALHVRTTVEFIAGD